MDKKRKFRVKQKWWNGSKKKIISELPGCFKTRFPVAVIHFLPHLSDVLHFLGI